MELNRKWCRIGRSVFSFARFSLVAAACGAGAGSVTAARAENFTVNQLHDAEDVSLGDSICDASPEGGVQCTLRAATQESRLTPEGDNIILPHGTITLSINGQYDDMSATGDLDLRGDVTITGQFTGPRTVIQGGAGWFDRIFETHEPDGSEILFHHIAIRGGAIQSGGGLFLSFDFVTLDDCEVSGNEAGEGGGIYNQGGELTLVRTTVTGNHAAGRGGGILNGSLAHLVLDRSLVAGNTAVLNGGGIFSRDDLELTNSTVTGNATNGSGGGIYVDTAILALRNASVVGNAANFDGNGAGQGGGVWMEDSAGTIGNSVLADNAAFGFPSTADCGFSAGFLLSTGHVFLEAPCVGFSGAPGDQYGIDPQLGPLAENGGPTRTHRPRPGSPLIDSGSALPPGSQESACTVTDQRSVGRPQDGDGVAGARCDIGAVEFDGFLFADGFETGDISQWDGPPMIIDMSAMR